MRLGVPYLLLLTILSSLLLAGKSTVYLVLFTLQVMFYSLAAIGAAFDWAFLRRFTAATDAFCLLNASAVVALYKFLIHATALVEDMDGADRC